MQWFANSRQHTSTKKIHDCVSWIDFCKYTFYFEYDASSWFIGTEWKRPCWGMLYSCTFQNVNRLIVTGDSIRWVSKEKCIQQGRGQFDCCETPLGKWSLHRFRNTGLNIFLIYCILLLFMFKTTSDFFQRRCCKKKRHHIGKQLYLLLYIRRYMIKSWRGFYMDAVFSLP